MGNSVDLMRKALARRFIVFRASRRLGPNATLAEISEETGYTVAYCSQIMRKLRLRHGRLDRSGMFPGRLERMPLDTLFESALMRKREGIFSAFDR